MKCQSISKYLVLSWNIGFFAILIALWLLHHKSTGCPISNPNSLISLLNHIASYEHLAKARYSNSHDDLAVVSCLRDH